MGWFLRVLTLFSLCLPGDMWTRNESGLYPDWSPPWEESDIQAPLGPERDATWAPETSCTQQDSLASTNPWTDGSHSSTEGQGCGNIIPDSDAVFAFQVFVLWLGVGAFACLGCCCACLLHCWLTSSPESPSEPEYIPMTISRHYGTFRVATGPSTPQGPDSADVGSLVAPANSRQSSIEPLWGGQDSPWTGLTKNTKDMD